MSWIKIFISHSTKTDEARLFLTEVNNALKDHFDVHLDETGLRSGDDWRAKLYQWMDEVHGAVLLLTAEALQSEFVQMEATILTWRRFRQPKFVLVPVFIGDVSLADIQKGIFGEMALDRIQALSLADPCALAHQVAASLQKLSDLNESRTAREILENLVINCLTQGAADKKDLRDVGRDNLGWSEKDIPPEAVIYEHFARRILNAEADSACMAVSQLSKRGLKEPKRLLNLVAPSWVKEDDAIPIARRALNEKDKRAVSLNGKEEWTARAYISRSCCLPLQHDFPVCQLEPPAIENSLADYKEQILKHFGLKENVLPKNKDAEIDKVKKRIALRETLGKPVFVVFPSGELPEPVLLNSLRDEFPNVTFFFLTGDAPQAQVNELEGKILILPPLDPIKEENAADIYQVTFEDLPA